MYLACPFGERRNDIRQAWHTAHLMTRDMTEPMLPDDFRLLVNGLSRYLKCEQDREDEDERPDLDALELMQQRLKTDGGIR